MAVIVPPDLGAEVGLDFPTLYSGQRIYSPEHAPEIPVDDIPALVRTELQPILDRVALDDRVAITAGSRGIANMPAILRACGEAIREVGGDPFIIPAMGSHGGATPDGHPDALAGYATNRKAGALPTNPSWDAQPAGADDRLPGFMST